MKKVLIILLTACLILPCLGFAVFGVETEMALMDSFGLVPRGITTANLNAAATKEDLVFMTAKLMNLGDVAPTATIFEDITAEHPYSGYIDILAKAEIIKGEEDMLFHPEKAVCLLDGYKAALEVMGFDVFALDNNACSKLANQYRLYRNVTLLDNSIISKGGLIRLFYNVLESEIPDISYQLEEDLFALYEPKSGRNVLNAKLGISAFEGIITSVNDVSYSATVKITDNRFEGNPITLADGSVKTFSVVKTLDINRFENVPSLIWVNEEGSIIAINYARNVDVKYAYVHSVNGDSDAAHTYSARYVRSLTLVDDDEVYDVSDTMRLRWNFKETAMPVSIIGNFAKIVMQNDEVIFMDMWELEEGGLISVVESDTILYSKGVHENVKLRDFDEYKKRLVFIDGVSSDVKELKSESVFYYYKDKDNLVLVASEQRVTDVLYTVNSEQVKIGNILYNFKTLYYATEGEYFNRTGECVALLGNVVDAYFNAAGQCMYIKPASVQGVKSDKQIGFVTGSKLGTFGKRFIQVMTLDPTIETKVYSLSDEVKLGDGLDLETILNTVNTKHAELILEFKICQDEIVSISEPNRYEGYETSMVVADFPNDSKPYVYANEHYVYFDGAKIVVLYEKDGTLGAREVTWSQLQDSKSSNVKLSLFGDEGSPDVRLALFTGETEKLVSRQTKSGLVTGRIMALNEEGETCYKLNILTNTGLETVIVPEEKAKTIPQHCFLTYTARGVMVDVSGINVQAVTDISGTVEEMAANGLKVGQVSKIDNRRISFDDGKVYFLDPKCVYAEKIQLNKGIKLPQIEKTDISIGDTVAYQTGVTGVLFAIVVH